MSTALERQPQQGEILSHSIDSESLLQNGECMANAFKLSLMNDRNFGINSFGADFEIMMHDSQFGDHSHLHSRIVEKYTKEAFRHYYVENPELFIGETPNEVSEIQDDISALMLFPYFHDINQLDSLLRNFFQDGKDSALDAKKGHGPGGALMILAMMQRYADANAIFYSQSSEIMGAAAVMVLRHDEPENYEKTFNPENRPSFDIDASGMKIYLTGEDLLNAFENDELDLFTLSGRQIVEIVKMQKEKLGFMDEKGEYSIYGLSPRFEENYAHELDALSKMNESFCQNFSTKRKERVAALAEIAYFGDMSHMVGPYQYQMLRTLTTQYSINRPFSTFYPRENGEYPTVDEVLAKIQANGGNNLSADDERLHWETLNIDGHGTRLNSVRWIQDFYREQTIMSTLLMKELGESIMKGDTREIERIFAHRYQILSEKEIAIRSRLKPSEVDKQQTLTKSFASQVKHIAEERRLLDMALRAKREHTDNGPNLERYDSLAIDLYKELCDRVIKLLCIKFGVSDDALEDMKRQVHRLEDAKTSECINGYDPLRMNSLRVHGKQGVTSNSDMQKMCQYQYP